MAADSIDIRCPSCDTEYELPESFRKSLTGCAVTCANCSKSWVPLAATGLLARLQRPRELPIDLIAYEKSKATLFAGAPSVLETGPDAAEAAAGGERKTATLRLVAYGPELDVSAVYELGGRPFLIGRGSCHLDLPKARIPEQAICLRASGTGLTFEGVAGFRVPLGAVLVPEGTINAGTSVTLKIGPYELLLEASSLPGDPVAPLAQTEAPPAAKPRADVRAPLPAAGPPAPGVSPEVGAATVLDLGASLQSGASALSGADPMRGLEVEWLGTEAPYAGKSFKVRKGRTVIGRTTGDMIIAHERVSKKHAQLDVHGPGHYLLMDLASTNGTTVNGRRISTTGLRNGDLVSFGGVTFKFVARTRGSG